MKGMTAVLIVLGVLVILSLTLDVPEVLAPVVNSGSAVLAVAFIAGIIIYRRLRGRKGK